MHAFEDLEAVEHTLDRLASHEAGKLVAKLPRSPGQKEARYAQLLSREPPEEEMTAFAPPRDRITALEEEVAGLRSEVADLRRRLEDFEKQFS